MWSYDLLLQSLGAGKEHSLWRFLRCSAASAVVRGAIRGICNAGLCGTLERKLSLTWRCLCRRAWLARKEASVSKAPKTATRISGLHPSCHRPPHEGSLHLQKPDGSEIVLGRVLPLKPLVVIVWQKAEGTKAIELRNGRCCNQLYNLASLAKHLTWKKHHILIHRVEGDRHPLWYFFVRPIVSRSLHQPYKSEPRPFT
ncbi:hypothetical protein BKA81DRAFT_232315 [Phyllosticta paracitricarpa]